MSDPLNPEFIDLQVDRTTAECGAVISGTFSWRREDEPRLARVALRYSTEGRGDTDREEAAFIDFPPLHSGQHRFSLTVPVDGPITYEGDLITLQWEVRGHLDVALRKDPDSAQPLVVTPRR